MATIKIPITQAEELIEWASYRLDQPLHVLTAQLDRGSTLQLPSGAVLIKRTSTEVPKLEYFISGYACDGKDVTIYTPLQDYDMDVMDYMYQLANRRAYRFFGGSEGLY
jgi:hypothetical protein